jgi:hypothetical protein
VARVVGAERLANWLGAATPCLKTRGPEYREFVVLFSNIIVIGQQGMDFAAHRDTLER